MAIKILVADADGGHAADLEQLFSEQGYRTRCARAATCVGTLRAEPFSMAVLGARLPKETQLQLCSELRRMRATSVFALVNGGLVDQVAVLDAGADDCLAVPYETIELLARVRALLRRQVGAATTPVVSAKLTLDPLTRTAQAGERRIELTQREFDLLAYLIGREGHTVTRAELLANVWGTQIDPASNVIDVHVGRVRVKLGDLGSCLRTAWRRGYRFSSAEGDAVPEPAPPDEVPSLLLSRAVSARSDAHLA